MMKPLSPLTYHLRHKWSTLLLMSLITLTTLGLFLLVAVLDSMTLMMAEISYLKFVSQVLPNGDSSFEPGVISRLQTHPDVARVIPENGVSIRHPGLFDPFYISLLGVPHDDLEYLISQFNMHIKEGRLPQPRTNEFLLSEEVARALGLQLGDQIDPSVDPEAYEFVPAPMVLVGILAGNGVGPHARVGLASYEYFESHELHDTLFITMLIVPKEGRSQSVSEFLETEIMSPRTTVDTYERLYRLFSQDRLGILAAFGIINSIVAIGAAIIVGIVNQIAMTQRLPELGLLNALGQHKRDLIRRLASETAVTTGLSWISGVVLALFVLALLKTGLYYDRGMELDLINLTPLWFVIPIPLTVMVLSTVGIVRTFTRFDAVTLVERGVLSLEAKRVSAPLSRSGAISPFTFYLRHRRRGIAMLFSTMVAILVITLPIFVATATAEAIKPDLAYLQYVSEVSSEEERDVEAGVMAQIKSYGAVERVIPTLSLALQIAIPLGDRVTTDVYGILEKDLPFLLDLFGMQLKEGHLPRARSNEIVVAAPVAQNLGLRVGDTIQLPYLILYDVEKVIFFDDPVEMVIVGLLERQTEHAPIGQVLSNEMWLSFASYEFMANHEATASKRVRLFIVPVAERKAELESWLEQNISSEQTNVTTYSARYQEITEITRNFTLVFTLTETGIALVAAIAVAVTSYISFTQRREEFGILNALGHGRRWLVLRTTRETGSVVAFAWLASAVIYGVSLLVVQTAVYAPKGITLNLLNPLPWLFTVPIPLTVIAISAGMIALVLRKLDPVSIIERR